MSTCDTKVCYTVPLPWSKVLPHELKSPTLASESCKTLVRDTITIFFGNTPVTDAKGWGILSLINQPLDGCMWVECHGYQVRYAARKPKSHAREGIARMIS